MRRTATALTVLALSVAAPAMAYAADDELAQSPPTTIDVGTSEVTRTVTTRDVERADTDDDDSNAGLWGLLGLLGLLGLAGLLGLKRNRDAGYTSGARISGDTTPRGSSTTDR